MVPSLDSFRDGVTELNGSMEWLINGDELRSYCIRINSGWLVGLTVRDWAAEPAYNEAVELQTANQSEDVGFPDTCNDGDKTETPLVAESLW